MTWGLHDSVEIEKTGRPAVTVVTEAFQTAADARAAVLGLPEHPRVIVEHPLASRTPSEIEKVAVAAAARIAAGLSGVVAPSTGSVQHVASTRPAPARAQRRQLAGDFAEANEALEVLAWTDGLPVVPPTEALVEAMLRGATCAPDEVLGRMEPLQGTVTVEKVAANAVMAGCRPEYFPVVLASVRAVLQPDFHVGSTACTTGGAAPIVIVNGPIAGRLGISGGTACFGGNIKANATIGRALRLVMRNLGGAKPDGMEKSTQAWPGKIACCFAENEARSPWEPLHVERGHPAGASTVTVVAVRGIYSLTEGRQTSGEGVLETLVASTRSTRRRSRAPASIGGPCARTSTSMRGCRCTCCAIAPITRPMRGKASWTSRIPRRWCPSSRARTGSSWWSRAAMAVTAHGCPPGACAGARPKSSADIGPPPRRTPS